jgi:hypothetical protein
MTNTGLSHDPSQSGAEKAPCDWSQDGDECCDTWATSCGEMFCLNEGPPSENNMRFCCYCGNVLREHPFVWEDEG